MKFDASAFFGHIKGFFTSIHAWIRTTDKLEKILIPDQRKYSALLKKLPSNYLAFINDLEHTLKRKEPRKDGTLKGAFRGDV